MSDVQKLLNIENGYLNYEGDSNATTQQQMQQYLTNQNKVLANVVSKLWQPSTAYSVGDRIFSPNMAPGVVAEVTTAGTSGTTEPDWTTVNTNVTDNTVTWTMIKYATTANSQPLNSLLTALSGVSASANKIPYFTGNNSMDVTIITDFAKTFLDDSDAATLRNTIGATAENCGGIVAASLTTNGYVKFANGLIIQWGDISKVTLPANSNNNTILYFNSFDGATQHNSIYRGLDLTDYFNSGEMSIAIANGTFKNIYPGDYIIKSVTIDNNTYSNVKWIVMDCDYHLHSGDQETTAHHVVVMPELHLFTAPMNDTHTAKDGYQGSKMWTTTIPLINTGIKAAFGASHVLSHRELLSNSMNADLTSSAYAGWKGCSSNWSWVSVEANICNENQVYGAPILSSSFYDTGDCYNQFSAFRLSKPLQCAPRQWFWLRSVALSTGFCYANHYGGASGTGAADSGSVRPYFLLK